MDDQKNIKNKSAPLASVISAIVPGSGFIYLGNYMKGISYLLVFISLIILLVSAADEGRASMAYEVVFFALLLAGFYIFQIIDTFNEGNRNRVSVSSGSESEYNDTTSLSSSILILILGVLFQLKNLNIISFRNIIRLWPLILIGIGIKMVIQYYFEKEKENVKKQ